MRWSAPRRSWATPINSTWDGSRPALACGPTCLPLHGCRPTPRHRSRATWAVSVCPMDATGAANSSSWRPSPQSWPRARRSTFASSAPSRAVTLVAVALALGAMLRRQPAFALVHAVVFALVVRDPIVTLWLNTLYTEFAAILFAYASVVLLVAIGVRATTSNTTSSTGSCRAGDKPGRSRTVAAAAPMAAGAPHLPAGHLAVGARSPQRLVAHRGGRRSRLCASRADRSPSKHRPGE